MPGFLVLFCFVSFFMRCIFAVCAITKSSNLYNNHVMDVSEESTSGNFVEVCRLKLPLCHVLCRTCDVSATAFLKRIFFSTSQPPRPSSSWVVGLLGKHFAMCAWNTAITRTTTNNWRNRCLPNTNWSCKSTRKTSRNFGKIYCGLDPTTAMKDRHCTFQTEATRRHSIC